MKILLAKSAGFCMGVKRAIDMAYSAANEANGEVYTHGPLIHNPQELDRLDGDGIKWLDEDADIPNETVIVRAHGVAPNVLARISAAASNLVDATCPKVSAIHERIEDFSRQGFDVVIAGDPDHPEVVGLVGHVVTKSYVLRSADEVDTLPELEKLVLVAQTTQDVENYEQIRARILERFPDARALSTICSATTRRQTEVRRMVDEVDAMVVIGGRNSANTKRLHAICQEGGIDAYLVESASELPLEKLKTASVVGVTAGASTPRWVIKEVLETLEKL